MMPAMTTEHQRPKTPSLAAIEPISMRVPDACRFTGISRSTLYVLIGRGEVEVIKLGASTLVLTESLRCYIQATRAQADNGAQRAGP